MKNIKPQLLLLIISLTCVVPLAGCGESPEKARAKLAQLGFEYSPDKFVNAIASGDLIAARLFLKAGMSVNSKAETGKGSLTALMAALTIGNKELAYAADGPRLVSADGL